MSRIFLSHSSSDSRKATALKMWLSEQNPALANEIFLDTDRKNGIAVGTRWVDELTRVANRCEAVVCLVSQRWEESSECRGEFSTARILGREIFPAYIEPLPDKSSVTRNYQRCNLYGDGHQTEIDIRDGGPPVSFETEGLLRLRDGIRGAGIGAQSFIWPPKNDPHRDPYRGWEPFEEIDAGVFFGRDAAIVKGMDDLRAMREAGENLFVVLGPSGAGKSSFLRAGLMPRLSREDRSFLLLNAVRPHRHPLTGPTGLAVSIHAMRKRLGLGDVDLGEIKKMCSTNGAAVRELLLGCCGAAAARLPESEGTEEPPTIVLPIDQAEELFSAAGAEARRFLLLLRELVAPTDEAPVGLIAAAVIRTDCYQELQTAPELDSVPTRLFGDLRPMRPYAFKEAITGPAERSHGSDHPFVIEPDLVDTLMADCADGADTLPILSLTLSRLYRDFAGDRVITLEEYRHGLGGMQRVVQAEIDEILADDDAERTRQLAALRDVFIPWLVTVGAGGRPMRRQADWEDLPAAARPLVDRFVDKRLLVKDAADRRTVVEPALECLLWEWDDLKAWIEDETPQLQTVDAVERDADEWTNSGCRDDYLLPDTRLRDVEALSESVRYGSRLSYVREFVHASRLVVNSRLEAALERERTHNRRLRIVLSALAITLVTTLIAGIVAVVAWNAAEARLREATVERLVAEAQNMLSGSRSEGDMRAFQQLLAARSIGGAPVDGAIFSTVVQRMTTTKIIEAPPVVRGVAFAPDGRHIASASMSDHGVRVWDAETGYAVWGAESDPGDKVHSIEYSTDGQRMVTTGADNTLRLWDPDTGRAIGEPFRGHDDEVLTAAFDPGGHLVASASKDGTIRIWDVLRGIQIGQPLTGHVGHVWSLAFSPDGRRLVSGDTVGSIRVWEVATHREATPAFGQQSDVVWSVMFSPDGRRILTGSGDGSVRQWDATNGSSIGEPMEGHTNAVFSARYTNDGRIIASGSADATIRLWRAEDGELIGAPLVGHSNAVMGIAFSPDGRQIVSGSTDNTVRVWEIAGLDTGGAVIGRHDGRAQEVAFGPHDALIVSAGSDGLVRLWSAQSRSPLRAPLPGGGDLSAAAVSPDGSRVAAGGIDKAVRQWNIRSGREFGDPLIGPSGRVTSVAYSQLDHMVAGASVDGSVWVWNAETGAVVTRIKSAHNGEIVYSVAFSPDGHLIASGGADREVRLWDSHSGEEFRNAMQGHQGSVTSVAFNQRGDQIVSGSIDTTQRLWDVATGTQVGPPMAGHQGTVTSVAFSPDGDRIVSGSVDRTVLLWDAASGKPFGQPMRGHQNWVQGVAFSRDGAHVASAGRDGTIRLWPARASSEDLCAKLTTNMTHAQWREWVGSAKSYVPVCPNLPVPVT